MATLSLCMIVKNEEEIIERCLDSVGDVFDEMILVDTGSTDNTVNLLKKYTKKVYHFPWIYDFSAARNFSFSKATCDYIMWLDADDVLYPEDLEKLKELKKNINPAIDSYQLYYSYLQDSQDQTTYLQTRARIVKNTGEERWHGKIHEYLEVKGKHEVVDITVHHKKLHIAEPTRNLDIYKRMEKNGDEFSIRDLYLFALELEGHQEHRRSFEILSKLYARKNEYYKDNKYFNMAILVKQKVMTALHFSDRAIIHEYLSFLEYAYPTTPILCELGFLFNKNKLFQQGLFWFSSAYQLGKEQPDDDVEYNEFKPLFGMAFSYNGLGNYEKAVFYNKKALQMKPDNPACLENQKIYLANRRLARKKNKKEA